MEAVEQGALPALFAVLRSLNRSKPHLLLLEATLNVFHHLAREARTRRALLVGSGAQLVDAFTDALQTYVASPTIVLKIARVLQAGLSPAHAPVSKKRAAAAAAAAVGIATPALPLRACLAANAAAQKRLAGVQSLLERKLAVELKSGSSNRKLPAAPAASKKAAPGCKKAAVSCSAPRDLPFDAFWCSCHGTTSSAATSSPAERTSQLQACCEHIALLMKA